MKPNILMRATMAIAGVLSSTLGFNNVREVPRQSFPSFPVNPPRSTSPGWKRRTLKPTVKKSKAGHKYAPLQPYLRGHDLLGREIWAYSRVSPSRRSPFHGRRKSIALRNIITETNPQF